MPTHSATSDAPQAITPTFYVVSVYKFVLLMVFTLGLYQHYWSYRNWESYRLATGEKLSPLLRSIVPILFFYPLLKRVRNGLQLTGRLCKLSPLLLMLGFVASIVLYTILMLNLTDRLWHQMMYAPDSPELIKLLLQMHLYPLPLMAFHLWLMSRMQRAINIHERDPDGLTNTRYTLANMAWSVVGFVICSYELYSIVSLFWVLKVDY